MNPLTVVGQHRENKHLIGVDFVTPAGYIVEYFNREVVELP